MSALIGGQRLHFRIIFAFFFWSKIVRKLCRAGLALLWFMASYLVLKKLFSWEGIDRLKGCCGLCSVSVDHISHKVCWERAVECLCEHCLAASSRGKWSQLLSCHGGFCNLALSSYCCGKVNRAVVKRKRDKKHSIWTAAMPLERQDRQLGLLLLREEIRITREKAEENENGEWS